MPEWSSPQLVVPGSIVTSSRKPAICDYNGTAFIAWATQSIDSPNDPGPTFSFTSWIADKDAWAQPTLVPIGDSGMYQSHTSALVVYNNDLYAFVPYKSGGDDKGCRIFRYDDDKDTFFVTADWSKEWNGDLAAAVDNDSLLHVICNSDDSLVWTYSTSSSSDDLSWRGFSHNTRIPLGGTTSNPALTVIGGKIVAFFLWSFFDCRSVQQTTLDMSTKQWTSIDRSRIKQSGNSGISAMSTPDGQNSWICFKKHDGSSNLLCEYEKDSSSWSDNYSMGTSDAYLCWNEAAIAWSDNYVYAVWNSHLSGSPLCYSRTLLKPTRFGMGYTQDKPSSTDAIVDMSTMNMDKVANIKYYNISKPEWVMNQEYVGSCTANAVATAYRYELKRRNKADFITSRLYLYYLARLGGLNSQGPSPAFYNGLAKQPPTKEMLEDDGSNIREAIMVITSLGAIAEADWGYTYAFDPDNNKRFVKHCNASYPPGNVSFATAKQHFAVKYAVANVNGPNCWKMCIHMGYPIIFGFRVYPSLRSFMRKENLTTNDEAVAPVPDTSKETADGGHAVLAVGWDDNLKGGCFLIQNSWGKSMTKDGFFWMPYKWLDIGIIDDVGGFTLMDTYGS
ncbi:uncharacterized protein FPRO_15903 [Fusarium proliferatum ET1]|uniref:Peptidase C1A papain C-terminal domain-containing protein n=1 Tax=Fusarium proliferatum (strain ET1) TaxID=1227346 RepID=A0A1L7WAP9_FUSPR|nr:uncharacterized protein FPRO_15903 [Fusarium proliferatum ET1]CZR49544.1 uncharacterized protein FPRO_15903 [Fusarium proliferatum ET1]